MDAVQFQFEIPIDEARAEFDLAGLWDHQNGWDLRLAQFASALAQKKRPQRGCCAEAEGRKLTRSETPIRGDVVRSYPCP